MSVSKEEFEKTIQDVREAFQEQFNKLSREQQILRDQAQAYELRMKEMTANHEAALQELKDENESLRRELAQANALGGGNSLKKFDPARLPINCEVLDSEAKLKQFRHAFKTLSIFGYPENFWEDDNIEAIMGKRDPKNWRFIDRSPVYEKENPVPFHFRLAVYSKIYEKVSKDIRDATVDVIDPGDVVGLWHLSVNFYRNKTNRLMLEKYLEFMRYEFKITKEGSFKKYRYWCESRAKELNAFQSTATDISPGTLLLIVNENARQAHERFERLCDEIEDANYTDVANVNIALDQLEKKALRIEADLVKEGKIKAVGQEAKSKGACFQWRNHGACRNKERCPYTHLASDKGVGKSNPNNNNKNADTNVNRNAMCCSYCRSTLNLDLDKCRHRDKDCGHKRRAQANDKSGTKRSGSRRQRGTGKGRTNYKARCVQLMALLQEQMANEDMSSDDESFEVEDGKATNVRQSHSTSSRTDDESEADTLAKGIADEHGFTGKVSFASASSTNTKFTKVGTTVNSGKRGSGKRVGFKNPISGLKTSNTPKPKTDYVDANFNDGYPPLPGFYKPGIVSSANCFFTAPARVRKRF